jgi:PAS domain S-box-containing protein
MGDDMLKQYKQAIEKSNIISKTDKEGIITFVNDEFCKISGYSKDELIGQNHNIVRHPDVPASKFQLLWDTINAKKIYKDTVKNLSKDGSVFYVNTTVIPILDEYENIVEFVAIRYDVTKEVLYKHQLQKKRDRTSRVKCNIRKKGAGKNKGASRVK